MGASVSRTAEGVAFIRAIESLRGPNDRLFYDPLAGGFLRPSQRFALALMRVPGLARLAEYARERQFPGVFGALICRTRYIDDALQDALRSGIGQVVILGAGFDSRAYRIGHIEGTRVFEVDRPAMLAIKQSRLKKMLGKLPPHVAFVGIDFDRARLGDFLSAAGYDAMQRTFFVWEGVTQYLTGETVDEVLCYVAGAAAGSRIAFTYTHRSVIDGTLDRDVDRRLRSLLARLGEPWITGFDPDEIAAYLREHGLATVAHVHAPDYEGRYLRPMNRALAIYDEERVVVAETAAG
jgi:methyltransferase (TIGR00027 family)